MKKRVFPIFFFLSTAGLFFLIPGFSVQAQEGVQYPVRKRASQYYLGAEDELLVPVNIWGFVKNPGQYMVPNNTDLISLLSFAGGPIEGAKIINIRIVRSDSKLGNTVFAINVKKYLETADERLIPILKPGDTIIVKGTAFHWIQRFFAFLSSFAVFAQMIYFIAISVDYFNR